MNECPDAMEEDVLAAFPGRRDDGAGLNRATSAGREQTVLRGQRTGIARRARHRWIRRDQRRRRYRCRCTSGLLGGKPHTTLRVRTRR